jgi:hypothetical protein
MVAETKKEARQGERHLNLMAVGGKEDNVHTHTTVAERNYLVSNVWSNSIGLGGQRAQEPARIPSPSMHMVRIYQGKVWTGEKQYTTCQDPRTCAENTIGKLVIQRLPFVEPAQVQQQQHPPA